MAQATSSTASLAGAAAARTQPAAIAHDAALDGVRGLAILFVLVFHLGRSLVAEFDFVNKLTLVAGLGWTGVDLFFVLSGFLITGILHDSKGAPHFFRNFYARRALRIFPLYFGALLFLIALRAAWPDAGFYGTQSDVWLWLYVSNFVMAFEGYGSFGIFDHFWSLAIEEQFYLVWPFLIFAFGRLASLRLALVLCGLALALRLGFVLSTDNPVAVYVLSPLRMDSLACGAVLALLVRAPGFQRERAVRPAVLVTGLAFAAWALLVVIGENVSPHTPWMSTVGHTLIAIMFAGFILLGLSTPLRRLLELFPLRWLGKYSYGLYVWHPILWMMIFHTDAARALRPGDGMLAMLATTLVAFVVLWLVTMASWHLMESQFLKLKDRFR